MRRMITAMVHDQAGALSRITSVLNRRQVNMDSVSVGRTERDGESRTTIIIQADTLADVEQVTKQLNKQIDVVKVSDVTDEPHLERELALIKAQRPSSNDVPEIQAMIVGPFRARCRGCWAERNSGNGCWLDRKGQRVYRRLTTLWN